MFELNRGSWIIAYTAFSPGGPLVSLAETKDFVSFSRLGPVMPPEDKDAAVFPRRFGNRYAMIHRPVSTGSSGAHIWLSFSPDLIHWGDHHILMHARHGAWWDACIAWDLPCWIWRTLVRFFDGATR